MKTNSFLEPLSETEEIFNLQQCFAEQGRALVSVRTNQKLIKKSDGFDGVLHITSGKVKIVQDAGKARETIIWIAHSGDLIGLEELLTGQLFTFDAIAMTPDVNGTFISKSRMNSITEGTPFLSMTIAKMICSRLDSVETRLTSIAGKRIEKHFAELLIELISAEFETIKNGLQPGYTIKDMAGLMGTSKAYLYKVIAHLVKRDIVKVVNKKLEIRNSDLLKRIADGELIE
jgi:CRP-like cAMP-binding protein